MPSVLPSHDRISVTTGELDNKSNGRPRRAHVGDEMQPITDQDERFVQD